MLLVFGWRSVCARGAQRKKWSFPWRASSRQPFLSRGKHNLLHCERAAIKLSCPYAAPEFIVLLGKPNLLRLIDIKAMKKHGASLCISLIYGFGAICVPVQETGGASEDQKSAENPWQCLLLVTIIASLGCGNFSALISLSDVSQTYSQQLRLFPLPPVPPLD